MDPKSLLKPSGSAPRNDSDPGMMAEWLLRQDLKRKANDTPKFQGYRLLVVEDDRLDWQRLNRYLVEVDPGCESTWCTDGNSALEALLKDKYDCVFIDRRLPDCDGEELIESLRIVSNDPWLPVVMVSSTQEVEVATGAIRKGATDYISKNRLSGSSLQRVLMNAVQQSRMGRSLDQERDHIRTLNEQLVRRNKEIQSFYQTVSHELKTPLTAIREFTSLINEGLLGPVSTEQNEALDYSISCCDRLVRLIGDLFDTARLENGKLDLSLEWFDPAKLMHAEVGVMGTFAKQKGITLRSSSSGAVPACLADRTRLGQVLSNLIGNALKFTPKGGMVEVALSFDVAQEQLVFDVQDTGPGIDPEQAARIFDRLYQVQGSPDGDHSGMGIGLYLCRQIIEQHNGTMQVSSSLDNGSKFRAKIPLMVTAKAGSVR